jgi:hypothetical protein
MGGRDGGSLPRACRLLAIPCGQLARAGLQSLSKLPDTGVVRILVAMMEPKNLDKMNELQGYACLGVSVTVKLKGYDFFFHREQPDFAPDKGFTPFFWKRKGDDAGNDGLGQDNDDGAPTHDVPPTSTSMDVDKPQSGQSAPLSKVCSYWPR